MTPGPVPEKGSADYDDSLLDFRLHEFNRRTWVSDQARAAWEPRIDRFIDAWLEVEWLSVHAGVRLCSMTKISPEELAGYTASVAAYGLSTGTIETGARLPPALSGRIRVVTGSEASIAEITRAWEKSDQHTIGRLLGYPPCCADFFDRVLCQQRLTDTTWPMALNTTERQLDQRECQVDGPFQANILLRWLGVRGVPHLPCSFDCPGTAKLAGELAQVATESGYHEEWAWAEEMLSWPVEWSALHGIAEVKLPVVKIATNTDATSRKYVVRRPGLSVPQETGRGLRFPYSLPVKLKITQSSAYRRGIANEIRASSIIPEE